MIVPALRPSATLPTVGHSTRAIEEFLDLLHAHGVNRIADVRRFPGSRRYAHFHPSALEPALAEAGIGYAPLSEPGGRRRARADSPHAAWRNEAFRGQADDMDTTAWMTDFRRLIRGYERLAETRRTLHVSAHEVTLVAGTSRDQHGGTRPTP